METATIINKEDVDIWFRINNLLPEKSELFYDFIMTLLFKVQSTYLGDGDHLSTKIEMSEEDKENHFFWCWNYTLKLFEKENIKFNLDGDHYDYFKDFFFRVFYRETPNLRDIVNSYITDVFDRESDYTKDKLTIYLEMYRILERNLIF